MLEWGHNAGRKLDYRLREILQHDVAIRKNDGRCLLKP